MRPKESPGRNPGLAIATVIVTGVALYVAWISAAEGHGNFIWARILFPYACACMSMRALQFLVIPFSLLQFPVYGFLVLLGRKSGQLLAAAASIMVLHIVVAVLTFTLLRDSFR
jgi:hypothetical protein